MKLSAIIKKEQEISQLIENFITDIICEIAKTPISGVTPLSENCFSVKLSTVQKNNLIMSADYYSPHAQAKIVDQFLSGSITGTQLSEKLEKVLQEKKIKINATTHPLNSKTLEIIKKYKEELL